MTLEELEALGYEIEIQPTMAMVLFEVSWSSIPPGSAYNWPYPQTIFSIEISGQRHRTVKRPMGQPITREIAMQKCIEAAKLHYVKRRLSV